jgi:hypothetical protein
MQSADQKQFEKGLLCWFWVFGIGQDLCLSPCISSTWMCIGLMVVNHVPICCQIHYLSCICWNRVYPWHEAQGTCWRSCAHFDEVKVFLVLVSEFLDEFLGMKHLEDLLNVFVFLIGSKKFSVTYKGSDWTARRGTMRAHGCCSVAAADARENSPIRRLMRAPERHGNHHHHRSAARLQQTQV